MASGSPTDDSKVGVPFTAVATITPAQWIAGARAATRRLMLGLAAGMAVVALGAAVLRWWFFVVWMIALAAATWWALPRRIYQGRLDGPRTWTILVSEDEYRQESDRGEASSYAWGNFSKAECIADVWVLRAGRIVVTLPVAVFDDEQQAAFRALLVRKHLLVEGSG